MKKYLYLVLVALLILAGFFLHHRYKTRQVTDLIGASQYRLEEYLHYPNPQVTLEEIDPAQASERVGTIIDSKNIHTSKPLLQYTLTGSIRKRIYWLADQGEGYYVIEAIDTSR